jgi:SEL1 protein
VSDEPGSYDGEEGNWYMGKAKEQFHKRKNGQLDARRGEEEDPIQVRLPSSSSSIALIISFKWAKNRKNAEQEGDGDFGPEDYFEGAMRRDRRGEEDIDEFWETMLLVLLCLAVSVLLYVRTRMVERMRRDQRPQGGGENEQPPPPANGGVFPPPGDPARNEWAVLR